MSFRYILRYLIDPGYETGNRIQELVHFCRNSNIEEVMLFLGAEELSSGHPTTSELNAFIDLANELRVALDSAGIDLSLNPWSTIYHSPRGRRLRDGQNFRLMVGESGHESEISPCPLCDNWQNYLANSFARLAREIQPIAIWVEDDWRLRNHGSLLGWGGCFCSEHLRMFSERVGQEVSREKLLQTILAPGQPHDWRRHWLDLSRDTLVQPLKLVADSIRAASSSTRVALMSGSPDMHAAEGRDWAMLQEVVSNGSVFLSRPTMKPYTQAHALGTPSGLTRLTIAGLEGETVIYPELENSPRSGAYSKSRAYSVWQMWHAAAMGAQGITINHYDMLGTGISLDPHFGDGLSKAKAMLDALGKLGIDDRRAHGVSVLFSPEISRFIQTSAGSGMEGLSQNSTTWSDTCAILGIASHFSREISDGPVLVNQQTLRAFSDEDIRELLHGAVLLDAESALVLLERGFGDDIGITSAAKHTLEESAYSYERIEAVRFRLPGGPEVPRLSAQRCTKWLLEFQIKSGVEVLSKIYTPDHQPLWPGAILTRNHYGGRIVTLAYPVNYESQFFMGFFNEYRRYFLQRLLLEIAPNAKLAFAENGPVTIYRTPTRNGTLLAVINPTDDSIWRSEILLPKNSFPEGNWECLGVNGSWQKIQHTVNEESLAFKFCFEHVILPLGAAFFHGKNISLD